MPLNLSSGDKEILDGGAGAGAQMAMRIVVRLARAVGASELMDVEGAHIDGCGLLSDAGLEFAETLASKGAKVTVPTTLSMGPLDLQNWQRFNIDEEFASKAIRQGKAYEQMGCKPAWTCAPYQGDQIPGFGQQVAWGESNAVCYANSVLGARTNRYGDYIDICAAITGRVPKVGLHLTENRKGQILFRFGEVEREQIEDESFYSVAGHLIGAIGQDAVCVVDGLDINPTIDQFKAMCAAAASAGATALLHIVGITPEAATIDDAFQGGKPEKVVDVTRQMLNEAWEDLSTASKGNKVDAVLVGCPHFSYDEFVRLGQLVGEQREQGRSKSEHTRFVVFTSRSSYAAAKSAGIIERLEDFGIEITLDTCPFHTPILAKETAVVMTDSGKCSYYSPGELDVEVAFSTVTDCVRSAVAGCVVCEGGPWK